MKVLSRELKQVCGTGGTVRDGVIEIQGDHRTQIAEKLKSLGYRTKFVGG
jgi:translation initiation factor 1